MEFILQARLLGMPELTPTTVETRRAEKVPVPGTGESQPQPLPRSADPEDQLLFSMTWIFVLMTRAAQKARLPST